MKRFQIILIVIFTLTALVTNAQVAEKIYEITITTINADGETEVKEIVIEGEDLEQDELDEVIQEEIAGYEGEVDVSINISEIGSERKESSKSITKITKQRNNASEEQKIIIDETEKDIEVIDDKIYIDGEEIKEGDYGNKQVRIQKFDKGEEIKIENILKGENIEIGEGERVYYIEKEDSSEGLAFLGIYPSGRSLNGVKIGKVIEGTSAEKMGLKVGDVLKAIDGKEISTFGSLSKIVKSYLPGETVKIEFEREGQLQSLKVALSDYDKFNDPNDHSQMLRSEEALSNKKYKRYSLHSRGTKLDPKRPTLGIVIASVNNNEIVIDEVLSGSAAEKSGLKKGDKIIKLDRAKLLNQDQFIATIKAHEIGDEIKLKIIRDGKKKTIKAVLQAPKEKKGRFKNNTSNKVERIIIKDRQEGSRRDFESGGAIRIRNFDLSPNPSDGEINVVFDMNRPKLGEEITMRIISVGGEVVKEEFIDLSSGNFNAAFDLRKYPSGVYLFQVEKNKQTFTKRFVLNRE